MYYNIYIYIHYVYTCCIHVRIWEHTLWCHCGVSSRSGRIDSWNYSPNPRQRCLQSWGDQDGKQNWEFLLTFSRICWWWRFVDAFPMNPSLNRRLEHSVDVGGSVLQQIPRCGEQPRACWFYKTSGRDFGKSLGECRSNWDVLEVINQNLFFLATSWPNGWFLWMVFAQKMGRFGRCRSCPSMRRSGRSPRVAWRGAQGPPKMIGAGTHNSPRWCWKHGKICFKQWISPWKNRS